VSGQFIGFDLMYHSVLIYGILLQISIVFVNASLASGLVSSRRLNQEARDFATGSFHPKKTAPISPPIVIVSVYISFLRYRFESSARTGTGTQIGRALGPGSAVMGMVICWSRVYY